MEGYVFSSTDGLGGEVNPPNLDRGGQGKGDCCSGGEKGSTRDDKEVTGANIRVARPRGYLEEWEGVVQLKQNAGHRGSEYKDH